MFEKFKKSKSIFSYLLVAMCVVVVIDTIILAVSIASGGIYAKLNQNAKDIIDQKVINRASYLQNEMVSRWSEVSDLIDNIDAAAEALDDAGSISFENLDESSDAAEPLIMAIVDDLINIMRSQQVTGAFVIFNNHDLDEGLYDKPGIYLRDLDPASKESAENADILIERAPANVVKSLNIATDAAWRPRFEFKKSNGEYYDFFYTPYQQAIHNENDYSWFDMGYWGSRDRLGGTNYDMFTYSVPLINDEGDVYGVAGIDITIDYLDRLLPEEELLDNEAASYMLAVNPEDMSCMRSIAVSGSAYENEGGDIEVVKDGADNYIEFGGKRMYASVQYLDIYDSNTPYSNQRWALVGIADTQALFASTDKIKSILVTAMLLMVVVGIGGSFVCSYIISRPVKVLTDEVVKAKVKDRLAFRRTHIAEIDYFARTMEMLNQNIRDTSMKFTNLLKMASVGLAGFEYNNKTGELFLSDNFFEIFLNHEIVTSAMNIEAFKQAFKMYEQYIISSDYKENQYLFKIPDKNNFVYVNLRLIVDDDIYMGIAENVTNTVIEKNIIEYERDHDALTGLLNRRAFIRKMNELFDNHRGKIKAAALLMLDLDNLKYINDNYGHENGDNYIAEAAQSFVNGTPQGTIISRISGDEFYIFFYGYDDAETIEGHIAQLETALSRASISFQDRKLRIQVSGGAAWYPRDSKSFEMLQHYADYAMYNVKHTSKGHFQSFNKEEYIQDSSKGEAKDELKTIIAGKALQFYFQPIISSRDGSVFGYEALMRSFMQILKSPADILRIAREENCLSAIEELTWEKSLEAFSKHVKNGLIGKKTKVFVNSISNQMLSENKIRELEYKYFAHLKNIVLEVTESESADKNYQHQKAALMKKWHGKLALDDYGSGYNSEKMLLSVSPKFIKVDMEIIRNIDTNPDKCKIVENIVSYAHERDMKVIAEGIETIEELKQVIKLDVDYLQGYLFSKPQYLPPKIQDDVVKLIQFLNENKKAK